MEISEKPHYLVISSSEEWVDFPRHGIKGELQYQSWARGKAQEEGEEAQCSFHLIPCSHTSPSFLRLRFCLNALITLAMVGVEKY